MVVPNPGVGGFFCLIAGVAWGQALSVDASGSIAGFADPPGQLKAVFALDRTSGQRFSGSADSATGHFDVNGLAIGTPYDCIFEYAAAADGPVSRLEGVDLHVPRSDYEVEQPLSEEDVTTIQAKVREMNRFEDVVDILAIKGNIQYAAIVVNKLRTQPFYNSKPGEVIWRLELWRYERPEETWQKTQDELFTVLYRERTQRAEYDKRSVILDPTLGGLQPTADTPKIDLGKVALPPYKPGISVRDQGNKGTLPAEQSVAVQKN